MEIESKVGERSRVLDGISGKVPERSPSQAVVVMKLR